MYEPHQASLILQGDIIRDFLFIRSDLDDATPHQEPELADSFLEKQTNAKLRKVNAIIATQTCDITRRDYILVCPIFTVRSMVEELEVAGKSPDKINSHLASLKGQKFGYYFYLEASPQFGIEESYADLTFMNPIKRDELSSYQRIASIGAYPRHIFAFKLGSLFMRPH